MLKIRYALCSSRVIRDADENRISVIDLLEDITVPAFPIVIPRLSLIMSLSRDPGDPEAYSGTIFLRLNDQVLLETELPIDFQGALATRATSVIGGLAFQTPGRFSVTWSIPGQVEATYLAEIGSQAHVANPEAQGGAVGMI